MRITVLDRVSYPVTSQREITPEGYLKVPGRVARIGIQQYLASELGLKDRAPSTLVNIYRPPDEVFASESLDSYDNKEVTIDHPDDLVDAKSFKEVTAGHAISPGRTEGDYVVVDLLIKDQYAIDAINRGKAELSAGYTSEYDKTPELRPVALRSNLSSALSQSIISHCVTRLGPVIWRAYLIANQRE